MKVTWRDSKHFQIVGDEVEFSALTCFVSLVGVFGPEYPLQKTVHSALVEGLRSRQTAKFKERSTPAEKK